GSDHEVVVQNSAIVYRRVRQVHLLQGAEDIVAVYIGIGTDARRRRISSRSDDVGIDILTDAFGIGYIQEAAVSTDCERCRIPAGRNAAEQDRLQWIGRVQHGHRVDASFGDV